MSTQLQPYIFFWGRCQEALDFYKTVFGGSYEMMRIKDTPFADDWQGSTDSVMHASFTSGEVAFYASDGRENKAVDPEAGNVSLALALQDGARGEQIFDALSANGSIEMPIGPAFWGGRFGVVNDKYGTQWMMTLP